MTIINVLIDAFEFFMIRLRGIFLFVSILILYILLSKAGDMTGKGIMKTRIGKWITERFKKKWKYQLEQIYYI